MQLDDRAPGAHEARVGQAGLVVHVEGDDRHVEPFEGGLDQVIEVGREDGLDPERVGQVGQQEMRGVGLFAFRETHEERVGDARIGCVQLDGGQFTLRGGFVPDGDAR